MSDTHDSGNNPNEPTPRPQEPTGEQPPAEPAWGQQPAEQTPAYGQPPAEQTPAYGQSPAYGQQGQMQPSGLTSDEITWGGVAHWGSLITGVLIGGMAFLAPLIVMLTKGNQSPYVRRQAVESLNFQLSVLIYAVVSAVLILVLIGIVMIIAVGIFWLVYTIIGSVKASRGEEYRYPLTIRMVS